MAHGSQAAHDLTYGSPESMLLGKSQVKSIRMGRFASREQTQGSAALELKCEGERASAGLRKASACRRDDRAEVRHEILPTSRYMQTSIE